MELEGESENDEPSVGDFVDDSGEQCLVPDSFLSPETPTLQSLVPSSSVTDPSYRDSLLLSDPDLEDESKIIDCLLKCK